MRYSQIRAFHHVARHGGFSRAAEALHLSQPAISDQVRKLERDHDVLLFRRDGKRVRLTTEGAQLFALTREMFEVEERIAACLSESARSVAGQLRMVVDSAHHVTGILARFRAANPDVRVSLRTGNSDTVLAALRAYDADIGVLGSTAPGTDLDAVDLGATDVVAFAAIHMAGIPARPLRLADLTSLPLVMREKGSRTRAWLEAAARARNIRLTPAIEAEGREAVREIVASGAGIGFVSKAEFGRDDRLRALPLADAGIMMTETLVCLSQRREVPVIRAFMQIAAG